MTTKNDVQISVSPLQTTKMIAKSQASHRFGKRIRNKVCKNGKFQKQQVYWTDERLLPDKCYLQMDTISKTILSPGKSCAPRDADVIRRFLVRQYSKGTSHLPVLMRTAEVLGLRQKLIKKRVNCNTGHRLPLNSEHTVLLCSAEKKQNSDINDRFLIHSQQVLPLNFPIFRASL